MKKTYANDPINSALDTNYREGIPVMELRFEGLTKREYFAVIAMNGMLSRKSFCINDITVAVNLADNLIEELNKEKE